MLYYNIYTKMIEETMTITLAIDDIQSDYIDDDFVLITSKNKTTEVIITIKFPTSLEFKEEAEKFSCEVLRDDASITVGDTTFVSRSGGHLKIIKGKTVINMVNSTAPEIMREFLSDLFNF